jgi:glycosyltransferase involved in cell wall biosynthesis
MLSNPVNVLYLLHDSRRSGVPAVMASLIHSLDRSRIQPSALFAYDGVYADDLRVAGILVTVVGRRYPFVWRLNRFLLNLKLVKLLAAADIVHVNSVKLTASVLVAKLFGAKVVFHLHEKRGDCGWLLRKAFALADCVLFCAANCAVNYASLQTRQQRTILNAIRLPAVIMDRQSIDPMKIVMLGSINRNKGQDLLLEAFSRLARKDVTLHLYGTVGLSAHGFVARLKRFVVDHGLTERVFFPGPTADAPRVFREATILVHSSLNECLSISVLEAMSYGVPVIANRIAGMDEIITDGENGFLVTPGDVEQLVARIGQLLDDPDLRKRIGAAGRRNVEERFDMQQRAAEFASLYESLVADGPGAGGRQ